MWAFVVLIIVGLGAFVFGIKEIFNGNYKAITQAVVLLLLSFVGNWFYGWDIRQEVLILFVITTVGGIQFFEK